jgi:hypothetical protein
MLDQTELDWLADERPAPLPLDAETTARARAELLRYATVTPRRRTFGRRALRIAVGGVVLAGVASVTLLAVESGSTSRDRGLGGVLVVQSASAKQLTHLSAKLAAAPPPVGDATLVLRRQIYPNSPEIDGADLFADNGDYYYSPTLSGLPAIIKSGETVDDESTDSEVRDIAAAKAALGDEPIDSVRYQMSIANFDPAVLAHGKWNRVYAPSTSNLSAAVRAKLKQVQATDEADDIQSVISHEDGMIWDNGMDALLAGAGDPQVRAGVLKLFATIPQITVTSGSLNGKPTLDVTASLLSSNQGLYQEELILDASTGIPLEMVGGNQGQTPSVTVYYTISRVTVADVENGSEG